MKILLAGIAALSVLSASAATIKLPDTITGFWCFLKGDEELIQQIYIRCPDGPRIHIDQENGNDEEYGPCPFETIEQISANSLLIYERCPGGRAGPVSYEIIDDKLVITILTEG